MLRAALRQAGQASQPSSAAGHDPDNCVPQVLIVAISRTAIRDAVISTNADHVGRMSF
jgi:hypothetical protein